MVDAEFYKGMDAYDVVDALGTELVTQWQLGLDTPQDAEEIIAACSEALEKAFGFKREKVNYYSLLVGAVWHNASYKIIGPSQYAKDRMEESG